ncbi:MAG: DUF4139 domain-containing protein, partial [Myxococcota bacterium]
GQEEIDALEAEADKARERRQVALRSEERFRAAAERHRELLNRLVEGVSRAPRAGGGDDGEPSLERWRKGHNRLEDKLRSALTAVLEERHRAEDAANDLARIEAQLHTARVRKPQCTAMVDLQIEASETAEATVELTYRTPCALWRPEHLVRFRAEADDPQRGTLEVTTWATLWQSTGESWEGVQLSCSTARPASASKAPLVEDDVLYKRRKTAQERKTIQVAVEDQAIQTARTQGVRLVDEMPGVDDGGKPLTFEPPSSIDLPSTGQPIRVVIAQMQLQASVSRVAMPEIAPVAHLKATATLTTHTPLLAGPAHIARGSGLIGRSMLTLVSPGEPFVIGLGPDDGLRVRRQLHEEDERTVVTGHRTVTRTVRLFVSNLSGQRRGLRLTERIPVSNIDAVTVSLTSAEGWHHEAEDGFVHMDLELEANATRELELRYSIGAGAHVVLPF